jgi:hypothetical protein
MSIESQEGMSWSGSIAVGVSQVIPFHVFQSDSLPTRRRKNQQGTSALGRWEDLNRRCGAKSMLVEDSPLGHKPKHVSNAKSKAKIVRRKHRKNVGSFGSVSEGMSLNRQRCTWLYHIQYNQSQVLPTIYRSLYSKAPGPQRPNPMHVVLVPIHNDSMMYDCCLVCSGLLYHDHRSIYGDPYMQVDIKVRSYGDATLCTARPCWTCIL